jgi:hypothetical protein
VKPATLRQQFREESKDCAIVDHIAHAFKHVTTRASRQSDIEG